jgi:hypothetical protein
MGDRFLLNRLSPAPGQKQFKQAFKHMGATARQMRKELAEAVARLFASRRAEPRKMSEDEIERIGRVVSLVVRLRGGVERDRHSRELEMVYGAEGTARIGLTLVGLLAGLDTLGLDRTTALDVVITVAMDSVPPLRRAAYEHLCNRRRIAIANRERGTPAEDAPADAITPDIAKALGLPTNTVRRALEDLAAYGLVERQGGGQGKPDHWTAVEED